MFLKGQAVGPQPRGELGYARLGLDDTQYVAASTSVLWSPPPAAI